MFPGLDANGQRDPTTVPFSKIKMEVTTGAAANADIAVPGLGTADVVLGAVNLTDLTNVFIVEATAELNLATKGDGKLDTVVKASAAGADGNSKQIALVYGAGVAKAGTASYANNTLTLNFGPTSTVADMEALILANKATSGIETKTGGTGATVLVEATGFAAAPLAGGVTGIANAIPTITAAATVRFPTITTAAKKLLVVYASQA